MRAILVTSGDDYAALHFENKFGGTPVKDIIENPDNYSCVAIDEDDLDDYESWELSIFDFGEVDPKFVDFIRDHVQDYDDDH